MPEPTKKRGRPREFDPGIALTSAARTFLRHGYSGTSLETLTTDMKLNKPSFYAAFGDKKALFMTVLKARYLQVATRYQVAFDQGRTLEESLRNVFEDAVELCLGEGGPPGCPIASASATEALVDPEIGEFAREFRAMTDKGLTRWIRTRLERDGDISAEGIGRLSSSVLHDIALRARIGESRAKLREIARDAAKMLARAAGEKG
jgi:AcrR family transcriptional regulator